MRENERYTKNSRKPVGEGLVFSPSPEELGEGGPLAVDEGLLPGCEPMLKIYVCEA